MNPTRQNALNKALVQNIVNISDNKLLKEKIEQLLKQGANPNAKVYIGTRSHKPALERAIQFGRSYEVIETLLKGKANANFGQDLPPIFEAIDHPDYLRIIPLLKSYDANLNFNPYIGTPLMSAAKSGKFNVVDFLIAQGADQTIKDEQGATYKEYALAGATSQNDLKRMGEYLANGADPNAYMQNEALPLRLAFMQNNNESIKLLMDYGADPYQQFGSTVIRLLIDFTENQEQRKFVEEYYKIRQEKIKKEVEEFGIFPREIAEIIASFKP